MILSDLYVQNRKKVDSYIDLLQDPGSGTKLKISNNQLEGDSNYEIVDNIPNFTKLSINSSEWTRLNKQFLIPISRYQHIVC